VPLPPLPPETGGVKDGQDTLEAKGRIPPCWPPGPVVWPPPMPLAKYRPVLRFGAERVGADDPWGEPSGPLPANGAGGPELPSPKEPALPPAAEIPPASVAVGFTSGMVPFMAGVWPAEGADFS
jgi:hypothetical protein